MQNIPLNIPFADTFLVLCLTSCSLILQNLEIMKSATVGKGVFVELNIPETLLAFSPKLKADIILLTSVLNIPVKVE